jgi:hypothetical protein
MRLRPVLLATAAAAAGAAAAQAAGPVSVTIAGTPAVVLYGNTTALSGTVSDQKAGTKVTVQQRPCTATSAKAATSVETTTGGAWSANVTPLMRTVYQARAKSGESPSLTVQVRPRVTLAKVARHRFRVRVYGAQSFAGKVVVFQRYRRALRRWVRVKRVTLVQVATGPGATIVSGRTFRSRIRRHRRAIVQLPQSQVGTCYLSAASNTIST